MFTLFKGERSNCFKTAGFTDYKHLDCGCGGRGTELKLKASSRVKADP